MLILKEIGLSMLPFVVFFLFRKKIFNIIFKILNGITSKTKVKSDIQIVAAYKKPIKMLVTFTIFYICVTLIDAVDFSNNPMVIQRITVIEEVLLKLFRTVTLYFFFWGLYNSSGKSQALLHEIEERFDLRIDKMIAPFISKIIRGVIIVIALGAVAAEWGFDVNGFITGLGIGGLAFALAAQDTLSNAFGGAVLITEKPFTMGDWISVADAEGVVEDLTFRSTKIRKFDKSVVIVPNSTVASSNIVNYSKRNIRRITYKLGVKYSTPIEKMKSVLTDIEGMLQDHPGVNNDIIFVKFDEFAESSLNIFMYYFANTSIWEEYLKIKEDTNIKILEILQDNGVEVAFPSQSIYFEQEVDTLDSK